MLSWADTNWMRVVAYIVVAGLCLLAGRRQDPSDRGVWAPFWPMTGAVLMAMAVGRAGGIAEWIADLARSEARGDGWYETRRRYQAIVVGAIGSVWVISVFTACWRIPERRRRYLPMMVVVMTIGAYVAIRMVSLHQVDSLLYRRDLMGMRIGTLTEYVLLAVAGAGTFWTPARRWPVVGARAAALGSTSQP